jgi:hypothetical protein
MVDKIHNDDLGRRASIGGPCLEGQWPGNQFKSTIDRIVFENAEEFQKHGRLIVKNTKGETICWTPIDDIPKG